MSYLNTIQQQKQLIDGNIKYINDMYYDTMQQQNVIINQKSEIDKNNNEIQNYKDIIVYKDDLYANKKGTVRKPTYEEVVEFLENDETERTEWTRNHDCTQFAHQIIRNAMEQNIYGCVVNIDYDKRNGMGHDIIVFDTVDLGIQYFEPQTDENVYMYVGMDYAGYLGYSDDVSFIVRQYDSCFERVN